MKKILIAIAFLAFTQSKAQVTFSPGLKAGYSASNITNLGTDYRNDFYIGGFGLLKLTEFYNMQFEVMYLRQGAMNYKWTDVQYGNVNTQTFKKTDIKLNYISLNFINKFNVKKFNFHAGPGLDIKVSEDPYNYNEVMIGGNSSFPYESNSPVDLTINLGVGYQITPNLGFDARMRMGIIEPIYTSGYYFFNGNSLNKSFLIGLNYTFNN